MPLGTSAFAPEPVTGAPTATTRALRVSTFLVRGMLAKRKDIASLQPRAPTASRIASLQVRLPFALQLGQAPTVWTRRIRSKTRACHSLQSQRPALNRQATAGPQRGRSTAAARRRERRRGAPRAMALPARHRRVLLTQAVAQAVGEADRNVRGS